MYRGCIGFSAQYRCTIGVAEPGSVVHSSPARYSGACPNWPRGTRARYIAVPECGPLRKPPSLARFCSKVLPNRYVYSASLATA
jgi:hypothetical protein